ncbi:MAG: hypothetical protein AB7S26_20450 [Sandaracinaceae bacterium]
MRLAQLGTTILSGALLLVACDDGADPADAGAASDAGGMVGTDAGPMVGTDAGPMTGTDAGPMTGTDAGPPSSGYPTPAYDMDGCLTWESATAICDYDAHAACTSIAGCGLSDMSQCGIDCTMATVLCLDDTRVDACIAALEGGDCMSVDTACNGWMHF